MPNRRDALIIHWNKQTPAQHPIAEKRRSVPFVTQIVARAEALIVVFPPRIATRFAAELLRNWPREALGYLDRRDCLLALTILAKAGVKYAGQLP